MSAPIGAAQPRPVLGRAAAALTVLSAVAHLLQVTSAALPAVVTAGMALACLPCAWHLWRAPTPAVWGMTATVDVAMLLLHATLMAGGPAVHHHAGGSPLVWAGLVLTGGQLALAGLAGGQVLATMVRTS